MKRTLHPALAIPICVGVSALMLGAVHFSGNRQGRSQIIYQVVISATSGIFIWLSFGEAIQKQRQREDDESPKPTPLSFDLAENTVQTVATPVTPSPVPTAQAAPAYAGDDQEDDLWDEEPVIGFRFNVDGV